MNIKKIIYSSVSIVATLFVFLMVFTSEKITYKENFKFIMLFIFTFINVLSLFAIIKRKTKLYKILFLLNAIATIVLLIYHLLVSNNLLYIFSSVNNFRYYILSTGKRGVFTYIFLQMAQVIFLPVPASIIAIAGALIYGPLLGALYCIIGVLMGSYVAFFLGKYIGFKLVVWIAGKENANKYASILNNNGKFFLSIAFLLPMFPDDILCLIAGLTAMNFKDFFIITSIFRPIGAIFMCYFGGGYIIPFSGWGIPVWIIIAIVMTVVVVLIYKNQNRIENWIISKFKKHSKKYDRE